MRLFFSIGRPPFGPRQMQSNTLLSLERTHHSTHTDELAMLFLRLLLAPANPAGSMHFDVLWQTELYWFNKRSNTRLFADGNVNIFYICCIRVCIHVRFEYYNLLDDDHHWHEIHIIYECVCLCLYAAQNCNVKENEQLCYVYFIWLHAAAITNYVTATTIC